MMNDEIAKHTVIATTTYYRHSKSDQLRAKFAKKMFLNARQSGYTVICYDGGSERNILNRLRKTGAKIYTAKNISRADGIRKAIKNALQTKKHIIALLEPEKFSYIKELHLTAIPIIRKECDVVIPQRKSLKSYPVMQQHTETFINMFWERVTGTQFDVTFGPRTFAAAGADYFLNYRCKEWDILYAPLIHMLKNGFRIKSVPVNFSYPPEQRKIEENSIAFYMKRFHQAEVIIKALTKNSFHIL